MEMDKDSRLLLLTKYKKIIFLLVSVCFLFLFYFVSVKVKQERFKTINFNTTVRIQDKVPAKFDEIFEDLAFFVSPIPSVFFVGLLTIVAAVDVKHKKIRWKAFFIPIIFAGLVGIEIYGKDRVESPAPPYFMIKNPTTIFPKYHVIDQYSYPSGHASRSLFIGGIFISVTWRLLQKKFGFIGTIGLVSAVSIWCLTISVGKIYLGHHWLSDIIGGWTLTLSSLGLLAAIL